MRFCNIEMFLHYFTLLLLALLVCTIVSGCGSWYDSQAFLFSVVNKPGWAPVKLNQTGKYSDVNSDSVYSCSSNGPSFGKNRDLYISSYATYSSNSHSDLGFTYSPPSGYSYGSSFARTFLAGSYQFTPDEIETFYNKKFLSQGGLVNDHCRGKGCCYSSW